MIQTLPLVLSIVMIELAVGSFALLFILDWRSEVKRSFLVFYALIYLLFTGLTYFFQQNFATQAILDSFIKLDKGWTGYQGPALLAFLILLLPYTFLILLDKKAGVDGKERQEGQSGLSPLRILRLISGGLAVLAGAATLLVMGMIYRPLAPLPLGGALTVAGFFAAALAVGGVMTSMWLGHWYLVTPALSERPLLFSTTVVLAAILVEIILALLTGPLGGQVATPASSSSSTATAVVSAATPSTPAQSNTNGATVKPAGVPTAAPVTLDIVGWLRILVGFAFPLVLGALAWKLVRERSFQSATGMLYLIVVMALAGEVLARGIFLSNL